MGLADRLKDGIEPVGVPTRCKLRDELGRQSQDDADAAHELVHKRLDLTSAHVGRILREEGVNVSEEVVRRHRKGECRVCGEG